MENPFEFGRELGADKLVNRQEEVVEVIRVIKVEGATGKGQAGGAVAFILDLAEEVPYNVQLLAHTCWEQFERRSTW